MALFLGILGEEKGEGELSASDVKKAVLQPLLQVGGFVRERRKREGSVCTHGDRKRHRELTRGSFLREGQKSGCLGRDIGKDLGLRRGFRVFKRQHFHEEGGEGEGTRREEGEGNPV